MNSIDKITILKLTLHHELVGYLAGYRSGKNILLFADSFRSNINRPTLGLITHPAFPNSDKLLTQDWVSHQRLHPILSNLLPEGALRELLVQRFKTHIDNEFQLLSALGHDLPGGLIATPLTPDQIPEHIQQRLQLSDMSQIVTTEMTSMDNQFSLAGVQMKFSMRELDGRFNLTQTIASEDAASLGDWIIKTPSTRHAYVPLNEYTAMTLARIVGVDIPEIRLVDISKLDHLPPINLPQEQYAFAIKRFDREIAGSKINRIHMEDFAQVLVKYPHDKYNTASYEQVGRILYQFSGSPIVDIQQLARRLLVNILLANGDAHLKNWSLIYRDHKTPALSPAYDILTTRVYIDGERQFALNLSKNKDWYQVNINHFQHWAEKVGVPWRVIKPHLDDVMDKARTHWASELKNLPMIAAHQEQLRIHWQQLDSYFRI